MGTSLANRARLFPTVGQAIRIAHQTEAYAVAAILRKARVKLDTSVRTALQLTAGHMYRTVTAMQSALARLLGRVALCSVDLVIVQRARRLLCAKKTAPGMMALSAA